MKKITRVSAQTRLKSSSCGHHHSNVGHSSKKGSHPALERAAGLLKSSGLKSTKPRQALLEAMVRFHAPFSTEELHKSVQKSGLDLVTVYRSLAAFSELAIVTRVDLGDGIVRYELASADGSHHHHFVCKSCQKVEPLDSCEIQAQEKRLIDQGYSGLSHRLEFFGICPDCQP